MRSNMQSILWILLGISTYSYGDTIDHYMNISNGIPQMEMKADQQSQAWARSARTVLTLTCDGIADSLMLANDTARQLGKPLFCLTPGAQISPEMLNSLIQQTYQSLATAQGDKDKMTVSQVALLGIQKQYPCKDDSAQKKAPAQAPSWEVAH